MKKSLLKYMWLWEFIAAAFVLVMGIVCVVESNFLYTIVGVIFVILGVMRFIPLIRTTEDKLLRWFYAIELIADIVAGALLLYFGIHDKDNDFLKKSIGYFVGGIIYLRGFVYFFATSVRHEKYDLFQFFLHIVLLTLGAIIIGRGGFSLNQLSWFLFAIAVLSALFVIYQGCRGYRNYRNEYFAQSKTKKKTKKKDETKEMPTSDEIKDQQEIHTDIIVPNNEKKDENHTQLNA